MTEKPILFSTEMVKAILSGRKTQTRRIIKPQPIPHRLGFRHPNVDDGCYAEGAYIRSFCPYGQGQGEDTLWVRETWAKTVLGEIVFLADTPNLSTKWKPSIHMSRKDCRLILEIEDIRIERLQDISEEDAIAEGIFYTDFAPNNKYGWNWHWGKAKSYEDCLSSPKNAFGNLWESVNGAGSWDTNLLVWVIKFKKVD